MKDLLKKLKLNEQNISMGLGLVVVLLVVGLLYNYFKSVNKKGETTSTSTVKVEEPVAGNEYTVVAGDSLWTISEAAYGSGYNWTDVYQANKEVLANHPDLLYVGTKLTLPEVEVKQPVSYTVEAGDNLWNISVKICQNGYAWVKTANENKLANPNLLYVGQTLKIICN
ncbi:MAG: Peptidoglycan-binding LysM [Candidatus Amesbacteria bacterium GW2011_GWB1_47_26]|uniref:Peptidoglycan-binding LysM n=1 Tax=Candidatus Amesbacteria bacterium GW2011_GWC2_45_19 TaxID=1618366 RepID=A0A0G1M4Y4_9BACT|nr:MAG: Peptidoglycan-binding LysM [Candidatus Amesbacteria bacterium GW2011_GWC2_45_19]KKU37570.1 MAG: Peptidoglycan-binding LysM [Candidatus Amesbacteria bacterium GW2011_GWA1_46_35]KKU68938.1 MAG: Peptidoglycan-binding LysM [Microgenomates group bacterium GW2011_GWC1_47_20]KKU74369.1 MAG: Peptidoglycan-binding LysM [Candidatus Amesbacteria bacterium GW2011_GWB1_47_26]